MQFSAIIGMGRGKKPNWIPEVILAEDEEKKYNRFTMCVD